MIVPQRNSLPFFSQTEAGLAVDPQARLKDLEVEYDTARVKLERLESELYAVAIRSRCHGVDTTQDVESYDGTLGVPPAFVNSHSPKVGLLQWRDDLGGLFQGPDSSPGDVSGQKWGSGGMISADLFLSAGHCFDQTGGGFTRPRRNGETLSPQELAKLFIAIFNFQKEAGMDQIRPVDQYPVIELVEYREQGIDYSIVRLGAGQDGHLPGEKYGFLDVAASDLMTAGAMLCIIQHPGGDPKRVGAGPLRSNDGIRITYDSIDTLGISSGAPILSGNSGAVVGVHTNGGCTAFSGFNYGSPIGKLRSSSGSIQALPPTPDPGEG